jgi:hypothetical protein
MISPWWLRLLALCLLGFPLFTGWPINILTFHILPLVSGIDADSSKSVLIASICAWTLYGGIIWFAVFLNIGAHKFLEYMAVAIVTALTTAILGALLRKAFPFLDGQNSPGAVDFKMVWLYLMIMTSVPFSLMSINLFSASKLLDSAKARAAKNARFPLYYLHVCLALRMLQHVGEVVVRLFDVWREEHPEILIPRNRREWKGKWYSYANFFPWAAEAVWAWIFACMMMTFAPLPSFVHEIRSIRFARTEEPPR